MVDYKNMKIDDKVYFDGENGLEEGAVTGISGNKLRVRGNGPELEIDAEDACLEGRTVYFEGDSGTESARLTGISDGMAWLDCYGQELAMDPACVFAYRGNV